jgi:DNA repair protein RecN (Recombination protein N)
MALIEDLELEFGPGLNVLTGETGAGKSFILRALNFLMGEKMSPTIVRSGAERCVVEALFIIDGTDVIVHREMSAETGRSRILINDRLQNLEAIAKLRPQMILHTSQHGQQKLLSPAYQGRVLDAFIPDGEVVSERRRLVKELRDLKARREELESVCRDLSDKRELYEFQKMEIDKVGPKEGEEDDLVGRKEALAERKKLDEAYEKACGLLHDADSGLVEGVDRLSRAVKSLADHMPEMAEDAETLETAAHLLRELQTRLRRQPRALDEEDVEAIEARLYELSKLKRKLNRSLDEIVALEREIAENLSSLDAKQLDLKRIAKEEAELVDELDLVLRVLNAEREKAAGELKKKLQGALRDLGFSAQVEVEFQFEPREIYPGLSEKRATMQWIPNPGLPSQPLHEIASGGELSRFLLALVGLISEQSLPTLLFDEVDAGVGGLTLNKVADRLQQLSERQQVILITHWPQLAARAERHFVVSKEVVDGETYTRCTRLAPQEKYQELARMAGGGEQGKAMASRLLGWNEAFLE